MSTWRTRAGVVVVVVVVVVVDGRMEEMKSERGQEIALRFPGGGLP